MIVNDTHYDTFALRSALSGSLSWLCIRLHDTIKNVMRSTGREGGEQLSRRAHLTRIAYFAPCFLFSIISIGFVIQKQATTFECHGDAIFRSL